MLPQATKLAKFFGAAGLDIEEYVIPLQKGMHRLKEFNGVHTGQGVNNWNGAWKAFQKANPEAKADAILGELVRLRNLFGI